jgi:hypothetical protein
MKKNIVKLFFSLLVLLLISCSSDEVQKTITFDDVYVSGSKALHATYWKNNAIVPLTDIGYTESSADTLIVKNNDVHILGRGKVGGVEKTLYWKNNVLTNLTDAFSNSTEIATICTMDVNDNDDVYFAGIIQNTDVTPNTYDLVYWENGIKYIVDSFTSEPWHLIGIKENNGKIYVTTYGAYYVNGINYSSNDFIFGVNATNTDVYVYGRTNSIAGGFYKSTINNIQTNLTTVNSYGVILPIYSICFDNGDVYAINELNIYKNGNLLFTTPINFGIENVSVKNNSIYLLNVQANVSGSSIQNVLKDNVLVMQSASDENFTSLFVD